MDRYNVYIIIHVLSIIVVCGRNDLLMSSLWTWVVGQDRTLVCWHLISRKWWALM